MQMPAAAPITVGLFGLLPDERDLILASHIIPAPIGPDKNQSLPLHTFRKRPSAFLAMVKSLGKMYAVLCSRPRFVVPFSL